MIKVLIIDDESVIRDLFERMLTGEGYEIYAASSGLEGIQIIQKQSIDIAFVDLNMPGMNGIATVKEIRKQNKTIILSLITGTNDMDEGIRGLGLGANDYLSKPFDLAQIRNLIEKHVGGLRSVTSQMFEAACNKEDISSLVLLQRSSTHILVVDDELELRNILRRVLLNEGYVVDEASDGREAIEMLGQKRYNLVITDITMPGANGIEVLKAARESSLHEDTDVIVITGHGTLETAQQALQMGACDYLLKPIPDIKTVVRSAGRVLQKQFLMRDNARLMTEAKKNAFELGVLYETSKAISYTLDYNQLIDMIMSSLHKICGYDLAASLIMGAETHQLNLYAARSFPKNILDETKSKLCATASQLLEREIKPELIHETFQIVKTVEINDEDLIRPIKSSFNIPLMIEDKVVGLLCVSSFRIDAFSTDEIKLLYTVSNQMGLVPQPNPSTDHAGKDQDGCDGQLHGGRHLDDR